MFAMRWTDLQLREQERLSDSGLQGAVFGPSPALAGRGPCRPPSKIDPFGHGTVRASQVMD